MLALPPRNSNNFPRFSWLSPEAVKKFIIASICLSATLASNAPANDKKHTQAAQEAPIYQGVVMRFPNGNGFIFSVGPFPNERRLGRNATDGSLTIIEPLR